MILVPRLIALLSLALAAFTLIRPMSGWGRLLLFIPKLFAGTFIFWCGATGLVGALLGWVIFKDIVSFVLGTGAAVVAAWHIYRIVRRSQTAARHIAETLPSAHPLPSQALLPHPWVVCWQMPPTHWQVDVPIGSHPETGHPILADLWSPASPASRSGLGLIFLHGSGWHYADKDFGTRQFFHHLASQGHVIADVAYTLAPAADLFGMVGDVKRAIRWMKASAADLGVDANRIVLCGGSAGGQLALLAAYTPNHPRLDPPDLGCDSTVWGVISYYGPPDLIAQYQRFIELPGLAGRSRFERAVMRSLEARFGFAVLPVHRLLPAFLGGTPDEVPDLYELGSPCSHIGPYCPPTLLLQGTHDFSGAAPEVRRLYAALKGAGCPTFLLELPGCEHGFDLYKPRWSPAAQAATYVTERFLAALI
jgi:acetyl esterase/lipase